jgi:hypothetical protein
MATFHVHRACLTTDIGQIRELFTLEQFFSSPEANLACLCESAYIYIYFIPLYTQVLYYIQIQPDIFSLSVADSNEPAIEWPAPDQY